MVSVMAAPLLLGCETSNRNYSQAGRVIDATSQGGLVQKRPDSLAEQSLSNQGNQAQGSNQQVINGTEQNWSNINSSKNSSSGLVEEELAPELSSVSDLNSQFNNATASNNNIYSNATIHSNAATTVSRPAYNQNVSIPSSVPVPQQTTTGNKNAPVVTNQSAPTVSNPYQSAVNEDLSKTSTSSGNWLLVDSSAARQDESNTAAQQEVLKNSTAESYKASQTTTAGPDQYRVVKGDTLYSIAFRYGLDYHTLADINQIKPPYNLSVGQVLTLKLKASAPKAYVVQKGDTLYSIARKHNQSVAVLASVNNIAAPYTVSVGQKIYLSRDESAGARENDANKDNMEVPVAGQQVAANKPAPAKPQETKPQATPAQQTPSVAQTSIVNSKTRKVSGVTWSWPTTGRVVEKFSTAEQGNKGLDIEGKRGQAIFSAADGQVVYSGNALRGFGNLIIINHSNEFLSAYAHNDALLVKEGQKVKRGQQIARMGNTDAATVRLHFEIRYRGQSVNPLNYLPK